MNDLVVLVADGHIRTVVDTLLCRRDKAMGIRVGGYDVFAHEDSDPGVFRDAPVFLGRFLRTHRYALAVLDVEFAGSPGSSALIEEDLQHRLEVHGWGERARIIAIAPELEAWVWSDSPHVPRILGLSRDQIHAIADRNGWWPASATKPSRPKELLQSVLRSARRVRSAAIYAQLARKVSLRRCTDSAFARLCETLREWFGRE